MDCAMVAATPVLPVGYVVSASRIANRRMILSGYRLADLLTTAKRIQPRQIEERNRNSNDTRIFSPLAVAGLCVTIGRYWYLFKRLTAVSAGRFYRFEHIVAYSSFKAHSKQRAISRLRGHQGPNLDGLCDVCPYLTFVHI